MPIRRVNDILDRVEAYHPRADLELIERAYVWGASVRKGQERRAGEPYLGHPVDVGWILSELYMDAPTIAAGLLHDVLEIGYASRDAMVAAVGPKVTRIVEGFTEIARLRFTVDSGRDLEIVRRMLLAMIRDVRILLIRLADRLDEMRHLERCPREERDRIAREALEIYAPLSGRLGINWMRTELEESSFRVVDAATCQRIEKHLAKDRRVRDAWIKRGREEIQRLLQQNGIGARVTGRVKSLYSIHRKMQRQGIDLDNVHDVVGFRVLVPRPVECYQVLGLIHSQWAPVEGRFKDYIAAPKDNLYQSLHTTVMGYEGRRMEVQIRTDEMDQVAERGIAAHWVYKEGGTLGTDEAQKFTPLRQLMTSLEEIEDPAEALEAFRMDLYPDEVYCFTPKGDIRRLPKGATVLDFAYAIHTQVGHHSVGARVDERWVPLRHELKSGQTIEILTAPTAHPSRDWLEWVSSARARTKIRAWLRTVERERSREVGQSLLDRELKRAHTTWKRIERSERLPKALEALGFASVDELTAAVGYGRLPVEKVVHELVPEPPAPRRTAITKIVQSAAKRTAGAVRVADLDDVLVRFARCCQPIPGDPILGFITRGRGITVHDASCPAGLATEAERRVDVTWPESSDTVRSTRIRVTIQDRRGALGQVSKLVSSEGVNITRADTRSFRNGRAELQFIVEVKSLKQLDGLLRTLRRATGVLSAERIRPGSSLATQRGDAQLSA
ncbi:MAG: bifunctional (p)ppGpp synthetase/guanosine-3',5'-bis(diphosphate) 3'-pyrophosphohydrolase [bacterium]